MDLLDSGTRREFDSGAVRDIDETKGRCDLMPIDIIAQYLLGTPEVGSDGVLYFIHKFMETRSANALASAIREMCYRREWGIQTALLEVSIHYKQGAEKYGEHNWEKGIPMHSYIDSAIRHYLKYLRGDKDEPHDRAFIWNCLGAMWTLEHHPELWDLGGKNEDVQREN